MVNIEPTRHFVAGEQGFEPAVLPPNDNRVVRMIVSRRRIVLHKKGRIIDPALA